MSSAHTQHKHFPPLSTYTPNSLYIYNSIDHKYRFDPHTKNNTVRFSILISHFGLTYNYLLSILIGRLERIGNIYIKTRTSPGLKLNF